MKILLGTKYSGSLDWELPPNLVKEFESNSAQSREIIEQMCNVINTRLDIVVAAAINGDHDKFLRTMKMMLEGESRLAELLSKLFSE